MSWRARMNKLICLVRIVLSFERRIYTNQCEQSRSDWRPSHHHVRFSSQIKKPEEPVERSPLSSRLIIRLTWIWFWISFWHRRQTGNDASSPPFHTGTEIRAANRLPISLGFCETLFKEVVMISEGFFTLTVLFASYLLCQILFNFFFLMCQIWVPLGRRITFTMLNKDKLSRDEKHG